MRSLPVIASLAALFISAEAFAQPAQPAPAGQPATTDPQPAQPPVAGQQPPVAGGTGGQTVIVVQGGASNTPEKPKHEREDGVRFRGGVELNGGVFALPSLKANLGAIGPAGHLGVQINDLVGLYAIPGFDIMFGNGIGAQAYLSIVVDFTFADRFSVGIGPDVGDFGLISVSPGSAVAAGGAGFGGRIHLAAYPLMKKSDTGPSRKGLAIGLDTRVLAEQNAHVEATTTGAGGGIGYGPALHVFLNIGYEAF